MVVGCSEAVVGGGVVFWPCMKRKLCSVAKSCNICERQDSSGTLLRHRLLSVNGKFIPGSHAGFVCHFTSRQTDTQANH
jgi:hypothetical protein